MHKRLTALGLIFSFALALLIPSALPFTAQAATLNTPPEALYSNHRDNDEDEDDDSGYSRERYSSSVQRKIRDLDNDPVEELPIPILLGVSLSKITPDFGDPRGGGTRTHEGQDILAPLGALVASPTEAVVTSTGKGSSAGIYVYTVGPGDESFRYMHLDSIADGVKVGTVLKVGDIIGYVGNTGNASGGPTHLHFEIRENRKATDPYERLAREFTTAERIASLTTLLAALQKKARND